MQFPSPAAVSRIDEYTYDSLPASDIASDFYLRIFILAPGNYGDRLQGYLTTYRCDRAPAYHALSYTWGSDSRGAAIAMDDNEELRVTANLQAGLQRLRHVTEPTALWIDAICIDQSDVFERGEQVSRMHLIYQNAALVVVWLGEVSPGLNLPTNSTVTQADIEALALLAQSMGRRIWWKRLWVLQEFLYSDKRPVIQLGNRRISIFQLNWAIEAFGQRSHLMLQQFAELREIILARVQRDLGPREDNTLEHWLLATCRKYCSEPKDRIYALLSLVQPEVRHALSADYEKSVNTLYAEATEHLLLQHLHGLVRTDNLDVLFGPWKLGLSPSWVVNFDQLRSEEESSFDWIVESTVFAWPHHVFAIPGEGSVNDDMILRWSGEHASGEHVLPATLMRRFIDRRALILGRRIIAIPGVHIDTIRTTLSLPRNTGDVGHNFKQWQDALQEIATWKPVAPSRGRFPFVPSSAWHMFYIICTHDCTHSAGLVEQLRSLTADLDWSLPSTAKIRTFLELVDTLQPDLLGRLCNRSAFTTDDGVFGMSRSPSDKARTRNLASGTRRIRPGDQLVTFYGTKLPVVLRPYQSGYLLVDACLVHVEGVRGEDAFWKTRDFKLL